MGILIAREFFVATFFAHRKLTIAVSLTLVIAALPLRSQAAGYTAMSLYTITKPSGFKGATLQWAEMGGIGVGSGDFFQTPLNTNKHALLWDSTGSATDLNPTNIRYGLFPGIALSYAVGASGNWQIGYGSGDATGNHDHALLWNGSANTAVDLNPTNLGGIDDSYANAVSGGRQVGGGIGAGTGNASHALLWTGSPTTAVDIHPTALSYLVLSAAVATNGNQEVGYAVTNVANGNHSRAILWTNATGASAIDLHPGKLTAIYQSTANGISPSGNQQVGSGDAAAYTHALLWSGSYDSAIDLHPTNLIGIATTSVAYDTNGFQQVGYWLGTATQNNQHALLWSGSANSAVDLHALLPANYTSSTAYAIDAAGDVFGMAVDNASVSHVVEWVAVPEPASLSVLGIGSTILLTRQRRTRKRDGSALPPRNA
jgi:hypothetical protein